MPTKRKQRRTHHRAAPRISHHQRRCSVCCHPEREAIEEAFLDWGNVSNLTEEYRLPGRTAIYRHAYALGLDARRKRNLRRVLERIIEESSNVEPTGMAIVRAIELYARLNGALPPDPASREISSSLQPAALGLQIATPPSRT